MPMLEKNILTPGNIWIFSKSDLKMSIPITHKCYHEKFIVFFFKLFITRKA